ncbi:23S rRNA (adenine(2030)-N(6))-methyltransferase RlmJ [Halomonas sp. HL-93]|uniref:23S rRNA (adenine(2030)-N(6))-methyltransferase RlmJ n=1 Tax=Halomonas sp. HL-93 TaxID=1666906 RepID=UPI0006DAE15C|nr:23S rRNA (adenine(2030)-N(6))-methyltransferase RlmJ [Halomonas sp. HL-93]KPQ26783.1 MAG: protein involved in catabolism of external DNA [Halomonas sp. HL-93]SBR52518.1 23S rRNA (adenine2030-N6)-methyltransferase [Halomonas sp. HL-93]
MLSYQHAYHAGNFADVHKHLTLFATTEYLLRKPSPVTYIDTHAGRGFYPLSSKETQRLKEYRDGVWPLWEAAESVSDPLLCGWLAALTRAQRQPVELMHYPGSPWWIGQALRPKERLYGFELHPGEHQHLDDQALPEGVERIHGDGLEGLRQRLPVSTPRVCILIDPSYERKDEYLEVADTLGVALSKARHAVVLIWYPLLPAGHHQVLLEGLQRSGIRKIWRSELRLRAAGAHEHGMYGSGMLVINPPWGLDERLAGAMAQLTPLLGEQSDYRAEWLVGE